MHGMPFVIDIATRCDRKKSLARFLGTCDFKNESWYRKSSELAAGTRPRWGSFVFPRRWTATWFGPVVVHSIARYIRGRKERYGRMVRGATVPGNLLETVFSTPVCWEFFWSVVRPNRLGSRVMWYLCACRYTHTCMQVCSAYLHDTANACDENAI